MLHTAQLCLPFHWIHREVALWVIWGSLCNDFVLFVFLVMFVLMLKASLMAHRCSFREDMREEGCTRCRPMGVSHKVRDEDSFCRLTLYTSTKTVESSCPGVSLDCLLSRLSFQFVMVSRVPRK